MKGAGKQEGAVVRQASGKMTGEQGSGLVGEGSWWVRGRAFPAQQLPKDVLAPLGLSGASKSLSPALQGTARTSSSTGDCSRRALFRGGGSTGAGFSSHLHSWQPVQENRAALTHLAQARRTQHKQAEAFPRLGPAGPLKPRSLARQQHPEKQNGRSPSSGARQNF